MDEQQPRPCRLPRTGQACTGAVGQLVSRAVGESVGWRGSELARDNLMDWLNPRDSLEFIVAQGFHWINGPPEKASPGEETTQLDGPVSRFRRLMTRNFIAMAEPCVASGRRRTATSRGQQSGSFLGLPRRAV